MWLQFSLQILPVLLLGGLVTWLAFVFTPPFDSLVVTLILVAVAILLFGGLLTFRENYGWNLGLLFGFAAALGAAFSQLSNGLSQSSSIGLFGIIVLCLLAGGGLGRWLGDRFEEAGVILWLVSWAYLLGWVGLVLLGLDPVFYLTWSAVGLVLFTGLAAVWFSNLEDHLRNPSSVSSAINIYLIGINLGIAALILLNVQIQ